MSFKSAFRRRGIWGMITFAGSYRVHTVRHATTYPTDKSELKLTWKWLIYKTLLQLNSFTRAQDILVLNLIVVAQKR